MSLLAGFLELLDFGRSKVGKIASLEVLLKPRGLSARDNKNVGLGSLTYS
jgi:hypothetical protein